MTLLSTLFPGKARISRAAYGKTGTPHTIIAPAGATYIRATCVGGGSENAGAAWSKVKTTCTPGESFTLAVGSGHPTTGGDTTLSRTTGPTVILKAKGATTNTAGPTAGGTGDVKRAGAVGDLSNNGGAAGTDDGDTHPQGLGGPGCYNAGLGGGNSFRAPLYGGGGFYESAGHAYDILAGDGRCVVEFFIRDPGY